MNRIAHFEIHASDMDKLAEFYRNVFGWEISKWENDQNVDYMMIMTGKMGEPGGINGGMVKRVGANPTEGQAVNAFVCTVTVDSIDEYADKAESAGGSIASPKTAIPGVGWLAYYKDPEGNIFGIMQDDIDAV